MNQEWTEYKDKDGKPYYYNAISKLSVYEKPDSNLSENEGWMEYLDAKSGKPYYYNAFTKNSVWQEPEILRIVKARKEAALHFKSDAEKVPERVETGQNVEKLGIDVESELRAAKEAILLKNNASDNRNKEDGLDNKARFKAFLKSKDIDSKKRWFEVVNMIEDCSEWNLLRTAGEKKQCFIEYQHVRVKEEKAKERLRNKENRLQFMQLLAGTEEITTDTKWDQAVEMISDDDRYKAISAESARKDLFYDFVRDLERNEQEYKHALKKQSRQLYFQLLFEQSKYECKRQVLEYIKTSKPLEELELIPQSEVAVNMAQNEIACNSEDLARKKAEDDANEFMDDRTRMNSKLEKRLRLDARGKDVEDGDFMHWFEDYCDLLYACYKKEKERVQKEEAEKGQEWMEKLVPILKEKTNKREITHDCRWRDFLNAEDVEVKSILQGLKDCHQLEMGKTAFEDVVDSLRSEYSTIRKYVLKNLNREFSYNTTFEEFRDELQKDNDSRLPEQYTPALKNFFIEERDKELARLKKEQLQKSKQMIAFVDLLTEYYNRSDHIGTTWDEAQQDMSHRTAYKSLKDEKLAQKVFTSYMQKLSAKLQACKKSQQSLESFVVQDTTPEDDNHESKHLKKRKKSSSKKSSKKSKKKKSRKHSFAESRDDDHRHSSVDGSLSEGEVRD